MHLSELTEQSYGKHYSVELVIWSILEYTPRLLPQQ